MVNGQPLLRIHGNINRAIEANVAMRVADVDVEDLLGTKVTYDMDGKEIGHVTSGKMDENGNISIEAVITDQDMAMSIKRAMEFSASWCTRTKAKKMKHITNCSIRHPFGKHNRMGMHGNRLMWKGNYLRAQRS